MAIDINKLAKMKIGSLSVGKGIMTLAFLSMPVLSNAQTLEECQSAAEKNYPLIRQYELIAKTTDLTVSNIGKNWFLSASDQYAYNDGVGNYPSVTGGYTHGTTRLQVGYGKQREGLLCIGGVCRRVPASNGITFGMSTSF